ncbi:hypothetical protein [Treponema sp.]|uniref:hypothetical protein n=1 Tax=Treponema sp. TaxID=166 RepID=UPI003FD80D23
MFWVVMLMLFYLFLFDDSSEEYEERLDEAEKENAKLKAQIEKLKSENMDNCINWELKKNDKKGNYGTDRFYVKRKK